MTSFIVIHVVILSSGSDDGSVTTMEIQRSAVVVTVLRLAIGYSDRFLVSKKNLLTLRILRIEWQTVIATLLPMSKRCHCNRRLL